MKALIDSDVLIDHLQGERKAKVEIARNRDPLYSVIRWMEVMCGAASESEENAADALFQSMKRVVQGVVQGVCPLLSRTPLRNPPRRRRRPTVFQLLVRPVVL